MSIKSGNGRKLAELHLGKEGVKATEKISPELSGFVIKHGFSEMYTNKTLDQKSRKIATIASLVTSGNLPQLKWHISGALENNLVNKDEIREIIIQMTIYIGYPAAFNAMRIANEVFEEILGSES